MIPQDQMNTVHTLLGITEQLNKAVGSDKIDDVLGKIYIRSAPKNEIKIERGGFWHWIQALQRAFDPDSYRITVLDKNNIKEGSTFETLKSLHTAMQSISVDKLDDILKSINPNVKKTEFLKSIDNLQKVINYVEGKKQAAHNDLKEAIHAKFSEIVLNFGASAPSAQVPTVASQKVEWEAKVKEQRVIVQAELKKAKEALKEKPDDLAGIQAAEKVLEKAKEVADKAVDAANAPTTSPAKEEYLACLEDAHEIGHLLSTLQGIRKEVETLTHYVSQASAHEATAKSARANSASNLDAALAAAGDAEVHSKEVNDAAQKAVGALKDSVKDALFSGHVEVAEQLAIQINHLATHVHIDYTTLEQQKADAARLQAEKEAASDESVTKKTQSFLEAAKKQLIITSEQAEQVASLVKELPTSIAAAQEIRGKIDTAFKIADVAAGIAQTEMNEAKKVLEESPRKPEVAQQAFRDIVNAQGTCAEQVNTISTALKTITDHIETLQAKRTREALPMPKGAGEKPSASAFDLVVPQWVSEQVDAGTIRKLEAVIVRFQGSETSLLETRVRIQAAQDSSAKRAAERSAGACLNELSDVVNALQSYLREPKASERSDRIRGLEQFLKEQATFAPKSFVQLKQEEQKLFSSQQAPKVSVDDLFKQLGPDGVEFIKQFHNLEACVTRDLLSVRYSDLKKSIKDNKAKIDALFADWQKSPTQAQINAARDIMRETKAKMDEFKADKVLEQLKEFFPYFSEIQAAIDNCPDSQLPLKHFLESRLQNMPAIARGILIKTFTLETVKQADSNSLAILLLAKKNEGMKEALLRQEVDPEVKAVANFVKRLIPSSDWLTEIQKDASFQFAIQEAEQKEVAPQPALQVAVAQPAAAPSLDTHKEVLVKFKLPTQQEGFANAVVARREAILTDFAKIEGGRWTPTEYSESGWWVSNLGTLARGSYASIYNQLEEASNGTLDAKGSDDFAKLLTLANYFMESKATAKPKSASEVAARREAKVAVQLLELHDFVRKTERYLQYNDALDATAKTKLVDLYNKLGITTSPASTYIFSKDEIKQWNVDKLERVMNEIVTTIEENKWHENWDEFVKAEDFNIQPYDSLVEELTSHMARLRL